MPPNRTTAGYHTRTGGSKGSSGDKNSGLNRLPTVMHDARHRCRLPQVLGCGAGAKRTRDRDKNKRRMHAAYTTGAFCVLSGTCAALDSHPSLTLLSCVRPRRLKSSSALCLSYPKHSAWRLSLILSTGMRRLCFARHSSCFLTKECMPFSSWMRLKLRITYAIESRKQQAPKDHYITLFQAGRHQ
jgi:hypothetical protein